VVHGDEIGAGREGTLDHELREGGHDGRLHVAATQHRFADRHEVRDCVVAIADELCCVFSITPLQFVLGRGKEGGGVLLGGYSRLGPRRELVSMARPTIGGVEGGSYSCLGVVQLDTSRQPSLGQQPELRDDELVQLWLVSGALRVPENRLPP